MRVYFDRRGRVRGYSMGLWAALLLYLVVGSVVFAVVVLPLLWPMLLVHGVLGVVLTIAWDSLLAFAVLAVRRAWRRVSR